MFCSLLALIHAKHIIPSSCMKQIVESLVMSQIRYCISMYGTCSSTNRDKIQKIINFCVRVVTGRRKYDSVSACFKNLKGLKVDGLVDYHRISLVRDLCVLAAAPQLAYQMGEQSQHQHNTRLRHQRRLSHIRTEAGRRMLKYSGVKLFNEADGTNRANFRKTQRERILSQY